MRMGIDYRFPVAVRGFSVTLRPLTMSETLTLANKVSERWVNTPVQQRTQLEEHTIIAQETLRLASTSDIGKEDGQITQAILDRMTQDELHYLYRQYVLGTERVNPALEMLKDEELADIVEALKKTPPEQVGSALIELSFSQLASIARFLLTSAG